MTGLETESELAYKNDDDVMNSQWSNAKHVFVIFQWRRA